MANGEREPIDVDFKTVASTPVDPGPGAQQEALPPGVRPMYARDAMAIAFTLGLKIKGAGFVEAALWGFGARLAMQALDWPPNCVVASVGGVDIKTALGVATNYAFNNSEDDY